MNLKKKVMMELQNVKGNGITPWNLAEESKLNYEEVTKIIEEWEKQGKVVCTRKDVTNYISTYKLTKYQK